MESLQDPCGIPMESLWNPLEIQMEIIGNWAGLGLYVFPMECLRHPHEFLRSPQGIRQNPDGNPHGFPMGSSWNPIAPQWNLYESFLESQPSPYGMPMESL